MKTSVPGASSAAAAGAAGAAAPLDVAGETEQALLNVERVLHAAGSDLQRLASVTMLLTSREDYAAANRAYVAFFKQRGLEERLPARSTALWGVPTDARVAFSAVALAAE
eukprot:TRINITY_DN7954_c0_g2_i1.p2 TRINITY_DN7954_c0_g2~~TRINITY_DN7954_c0_g2_i1.p2  ORF type:complete len:110 (+),score=35.85 TRINITY_DN7954_c0_g2_i1:383-712(+)